MIFPPPDGSIGTVAAAETFLLRPDLVPGPGGVIADPAHGITYEAPRGFRRAFRRLAVFLRVPRSRRQIRRFLREQDVREPGDPVALLAPILVASEEGGGSRYGDVYERRSRLLARAGEFVFMNHGYAGLRETGRSLSWVRPEDRGAAYHLGLVRETVRGVAIDGRDVLDVGCGRGGTCSYLVRYHEPATVRGLDYCASSVAFCRRRHRSPKLRFSRGDAHALPFDDASFHVVTNIESSHGYPAVWKFYREARRVLRRRGHLCYADLMRPDEVGAKERLLEHARFRVRRRRDVTANVRLALERNAESLRRTLRAMARSLGTRAAREHLRELERDLHQGMLGRYRDGSLVYRVWLLQKP